VASAVVAEIVSLGGAPNTAAQVASAVVISTENTLAPTKNDATHVASVVIADIVRSEDTRNTAAQVAAAVLAAMDSVGSMENPAAHVASAVVASMEKFTVVSAPSAKYVVALLPGAVTNKVASLDNKIREVYAEALSVPIGVYVLSSVQVVPDRVRTEYTPGYGTVFDSLATTTVVPSSDMETAFPNRSVFTGSLFVSVDCADDPHVPLTFA